MVQPETMVSDPPITDEMAENYTRDDPACTEEAFSTALAKSQDEVLRLRVALRACIARAGLPDAGDGCRAVIRTAKEALRL